MVRRKKLLKIYELINKANDYHARLLESSVGLTSALRGINDMKSKIIPQLIDTWQEIEENIVSLNDSKIKN